MYPAAPTSNNLMKFEEVPVSYYTGIPDISIPLISIPTNNSNVSVSVSLKYHPLSAKPEDKASEVGLGWSLIAGGTITRAIKGGMTDELTAVIPFSDKPKSILGVYHSDVNKCITGNCQNYTGQQEKEFLYYGLSGKWDTEYDLYQYSFMGFNGRFYVIKDSSGKLQVKKLDKNNLSIECNVDENSNLTLGTKPLAFKIIDDKGMKYIFNVLENTYNTTTTVNGDNLSFSFDAGGVTAFHLNKVLDPKNNILINYLYSEARRQDLPQQVQRTTKFPLNQQLHYGPLNSTIMQYSLKSNTKSTTTHTDVRHLLEIEIVGKGNIIFDYAKGRYDTNYGSAQTQLYKLNSVSSGIKNGSNFILNEKYSLGYDYTQTNYKERQTSLLNYSGKMILKTVVRKDRVNADVMSYELAYNQNSETLEIDPWGYYKGLTGSGILTDVLDYMIIPTGGKIKYNFEENVYSYKPSIGVEGINLIEDQYEFIDHESQIEFEEYNNKLLFFETDRHQTVNLESFVQNTPSFPWRLNVYKQRSDGAFNTLPDFSIESKNSGSGPCQICPPDNNPNENPGNNEPVSDVDYYAKELPEGKYFASFVPKNTNSTNFPAINYFKAYTSSRIPKNEHFAKGGGVRISSINYYKDTNSNAAMEKALSYDYRDINDASLSSGALAYPIPIYEYKEEYTSTGTGADSHFFSGTYNNSTNYNILPVQKTQGGDVGYQYITVKEQKNNEDLGKTIYKFSSPIDEPGETFFSCNTENLKLPIIPLPNFDYKRGLQLEEIVLGKTGDSITHKKNTYQFTHISENVGYRFEDATYNNVDSDRSKYISQQAFDPNRSYNAALGVFYYVTEHLGTSKLSSSVEKSFFYENGKKTMTTKKNYVYNNNDLPVYTKTEFPDHNIMEEAKSYSTEVTDQNLTGANMIGIPLVTETKNNGKVISKTETVYENLLPKYVNSYSLGSATSKEEIRFDFYDERGNLRQYTTKDGNSVTVIWGYNQSQPIAKIDGAKYSDVQSHLGNIVALSDADFYAGTNNDESALTIALDDFRNKSILSAYQITTYTHDPLVGVRTITPPSGITATYIYDDANRLDKIVDSNGNILKEYKYSYRQ
ncbi:hypothetical protein IO90_12825 [Chryseobacterium sp. FH1]|nr:hypothetical protein IO90_12825 [Chryseobacterium sp. FH1]